MTYSTPDVIERESAVWETAHLLEVQRDEQWETAAEDIRQRIVERVRTDARKMVERLLKALDDRDLDTLKACLWKDNRLWCALFSRMTGLPVGRTQKSVDAAVRQWYGAEAYDEHFDRKRQAHQQRLQDEQAAREARQEQAALAVRARWQEVELNLGTRTTEANVVDHEGTLQDFIDWCIAREYAPKAKRRGVTNVLTLVRADGRFYTLRGNFRYLFAYATRKHAEHLQQTENQHV